MQAGREFASAPLGLRLREMQNQAQMAAEQNTTVMVVPANLDAGVVRALEKVWRWVEGERSEEGGGAES